MASIGARQHLALTLSVALHIALVAFANHRPAASVAEPPQSPSLRRSVLVMSIAQPPNLARWEEPVPALPQPTPAPVFELKPVPLARPTTPVPIAQRVLESMDAPPAPTSQDWALAANYTLKNSKRYRYTWGQQIRSMMGAAVEGADQGAVRFRVEIAPNGTVVRIDTLWSTSAKAEQLARRAMADAPDLPPTPTGEPLIFEKTISFQPFASDGPPLYKDDCLPDPPAFRNPFVWDGKSPSARAEPVRAAKLDPQAQAECMRQLPQDSLEAQSAHDQRLIDQGRSSTLGR